MEWRDLTSFAAGSIVGCFAAIIAFVACLGRDARMLTLALIAGIVGALVPVVGGWCKARQKLGPAVVSVGELLLLCLGAVLPGVIALIVINVF